METWCALRVSAPHRKRRNRIQYLPKFQGKGLLWRESRGVLERKEVLWDGIDWDKEKINNKK